MDRAMLDAFERDYVEGREAQDLAERHLPVDGTGLRLLDLGCGYGSFVREAVARGYWAVGLDAAEFELSESRSAAPDEGRWVVGDGNRLPFEDDTFDVVTMWNVLEHVPDPARLLAESVRVLRPGGCLLGIAPNYASFRREAHYQVPWLPMMPKAIAEAYLKLLGRDPAFLRNHVFYRTPREVRRLLASLPLDAVDPDEAKLEDPSRIGNALMRRLVLALRRTGLLPAARVLFRIRRANPMRRYIDVSARKRASG
jgi:ubiquinone/menaquinone biosynthesis C-methylase UbiE